MRKQGMQERRTKQREWFVAIATAFGALMLGTAMAQTTPPKVDALFFESKVRPLLAKRCLGCHGVGQQMAHFDLRSREALLKGGGRGVAVVPGNAEKSLLTHLVTGKRSPLMPPGGKLPAAELQILKQWIDGGAPWSGGSVEKANKQVWWAFAPPVLPNVRTTGDTGKNRITTENTERHGERKKAQHSGPQSKIKNQKSKIENPIDAFVLAKLEEAGLSPSPPAPRETLIRRAYLDLIGLPPTPEEIAAFVKDKSPQAWEKVVDRLLASPRYGERWGRHWLDLVRYADSGGFEGDKDRPLAWRYRDYVIAAFNQDKPYNLFLKEQLAGDELRPGDIEATVATGYLACGPQDIVENNARTRSNELDDLVSTTASVFLGLTIGCARCHDHKYDPVKITDYYRLSAVFAPTERREIDIPTPEEKRAIDARNAEVDKAIAPFKQEAEPLRQKGTEAAKKAGQANPNEEQILAALPEAEKKRLSALLATIKKEEEKRITPPRTLAVTDKGRTFGPSHVLLRGDAYHPGDEVQPGFICTLSGGTATVPATAATEKTTGRRLALAEWIANPSNPLTARVWMNRVWRQHFGRGIVDSPSNFGISGELPTHPELLDWLALKFQSYGWRLKPMHRLMLLSATYQQASAIRADAMKRDPLNKYYWRIPVRRLEAEAIRDSMLSVAGTLNLTMGGPPVYPPVDPSLRGDTFQGPNWQDGKDDSSTWRRSVYVKVKRSLILPHLDVFDCPEITYSVAQRNTTTTPLQALLLLNDPLILRQSALFAERLQKEVGSDPRRQIERAYRLAVCRAPTEKERTLSLKFLKTRTLAEFCQAVLNLNEFVYVP